MRHERLIITTLVTGSIIGLAATAAFSQILGGGRTAGPVLGGPMITGPISQIGRPTVLPNGSDIGSRTGGRSSATEQPDPAPPYPQPSSGQGRGGLIPSGEEILHP